MYELQRCELHESIDATSSVWVHWLAFLFELKFITICYHLCYIYSILLHSTDIQI